MRFKYETTKVSRKQLYEQVWTTPMLRLCKEYGLSDVGLKKICTGFDVPTPYLGYWAKKEHGKNPRQTPLPDPQRESSIEMHHVDEEQVLSPDCRKEVDQAIQEEKTREARIVVAETLRGSHELVSRANQELQGANVDRDGLIHRPDSCTLDIRVAKCNLRRSLLTMDALLKAFVKRGYDIDPGPSVEILDEKVSFGIWEQLDTKQEEPKDHDLDGHYSFGHSRFLQEKVPSGRLVLQIHETSTCWGCRKSWRDGKKQRIEDRLNNFVVSLMQLVARKKEHRQEEERRARDRREAELRRQEVARIRAERIALIKAEQQRVDSLIQKAEDWRSSQALRVFIEAAKGEHISVNGSIGTDTEFAEWVQWATQQADRLDPLKEGPPSILDAQVEEEAQKKANWRSSYWGDGA